MTISYSIDNVSASADAVAVPQLTQASLKLKGTEVNRQDGSVVTTYAYPVGDPTYPLTVVVRTQMLTKNGIPGERRSSVTINTWARIVEDGTVLAVKPVSFVWAMNTPGIAMEAGDLLGASGNLFGLLFPSVDGSDIPSAAHISSLMFGLTELYG